MRIGFDIDGVLYDFEGALRDYLVKDCGVDAETLPEATVWEFYDQWDMSRETFNELCEDALRNYGLFRRMPPFEGAVKAVNKIKAAGHEVIIVTARGFGMPEVVKKQTVRWLRRWGFPYDELHFSSKKYEFDCDYFIDDNLKNYGQLLGAGVNAFLCDRPYNQDLSVGNRGTLQRYVMWVLEQAALNARVDIDPATGAADIAFDSGIEARVGGSEIRVTSPTGGQKGKKLARFDLIPPAALWQVAELYGIGAEKYDDWNWRKGYDWSLSIAALERHFSLFKQGIDFDDETGMPHLTSVVFHALTLLTFMEEQQQFDDRFKKSGSEGSTPQGGVDVQGALERLLEAPRKAPGSMFLPDCTGFGGCGGACCSVIR